MKNTIDADCSYSHDYKSFQINISSQYDECRICLIEDLKTNLMKLCRCNTLLHLKCLVQWVEHPLTKKNRWEKGKPHCQICLHPYRIKAKKQHVFGCERQQINIKQILFDIIFLLIVICLFVGFFIIESQSVEKTYAFSVLLVIFGSLGTLLLLTRIIIRYCMKKVRIYTPQ